MRFTATLTLGLLLAACGSQAPPTPRDREAPEETVFYEGTGTVVELMEDHVRIEHDSIPNFMDAMTMSFPVSDPELLDGLEPGTDVSFRVAVTGRAVVIDRIGPGERPR